MQHINPLPSIKTIRNYFEFIRVSSFPPKLHHNKIWKTLMNFSSVAKLLPSCYMYYHQQLQQGDKSHYLLCHGFEWLFLTKRPHWIHLHSWRWASISIITTCTSHWKRRQLTTAKRSRSTQKHCCLPAAVKCFCTLVHSVILQKHYSMDVHLHPYHEKYFSGF